MLLVIYAALLLFFWVRALLIKPEHFPQAKIDDVLAWKTHRIRLYKRYAVLLFIWIILSVCNGWVASHWQTSENPGAWHHMLTIAIIVTLIYSVGIIVYAAVNARKNWQIRKQLLDH